MRSSILAFAILYLGTTAAIACDANPICTVKDPTGTPLNIRLGPNETIVGTAKNGTRLEFIDHIENKGKLWARVARYDPKLDTLTYEAGYVFADYLDCTEALAEGEYGDEIQCKVNDPTGTPLNYRSGPNGEILGTVRNGEVLRIFKVTAFNGKLWAYAWRDPNDNPVGWVFDDYLQCEEDEH